MLKTSVFGGFQNDLLVELQNDLKNAQKSTSKSTSKRTSKKDPQRCNLWHFWRGVGSLEGYPQGDPFEVVLRLFLGRFQVPFGVSKTTLLEKHLVVKMMPEIRFPKPPWEEKRGGGIREAFRYILCCIVGNVLARSAFLRGLNHICADNRPRRIWKEERITQRTQPQLTSFHLYILSHLAR